MLKRFLQDIVVVLSKKRLQKTDNIRKMRALLAEIGHQAKAIAFAKWSLWVKN